ncbi:MAG: NAD(P)H-binding protein, partial [Deltaproteobacteria bacterium]
MKEYSGKILITGATGFVGGRLLQHFTAQGIKVRCLVRSPDKLRNEFSRSEDVDVVV